jgi:Protein of unknown function (DUF732)
VNQSKGTMRAPPSPGKGTTPLMLRAIVIVAAFVLTVAGCGGSDHQQTIPDAQLLPSGPPPTIEAHIRARPWASSKAAGQAFGRVWREETRAPRDRDGRGIDAYNWGVRTCDAVRKDGQSPEAMVRRVREQANFTQQGATVIVTAALRALCPDQATLSPLRP